MLNQGMHRDLKFMTHAILEVRQLRKQQTGKEELLKLVEKIKNR